MHGKPFVRFIVISCAAMMFPHLLAAEETASAESTQSALSRFSTANIAEPAEVSESSEDNPWQQVSLPQSTDTGGLIDKLGEVDLIDKLGEDGPDADAFSDVHWESLLDHLNSSSVDSEQTPKSMPSGFSGKSGVTPQSLALPDGSGTMQGMGESFSPNLNTGSGGFSVPIALPPGRRGLQPQVGLSYSTGGGDGPLGWGWGRQMGVPFISRQTDKGIPRYTDSDRFMYNGGQELVPIDMPSDEDWPSAQWNPSTAGDSITYFRARIEGAFLRFFYNRDLDTWLVQDRQGNHYYYGESDTAKIIGPKGTYLWSLSRIADVRRATDNGGNDVHYAYQTDGRNLYVKNIYWSSMGEAYGDVASYQHQLHFVYETRPDTSISFATGFGIEQNLRLKRIEVRSFQYAPDGVRPLTRVYLITYEDETVSIHSRIVRIQTCGRDWTEKGSGTCMPTLDLKYSEIQGLSSDGLTPSASIAGFGSFNEMVRSMRVSPDESPEDPNVDFMDVNQDGLPDVLITKPEYFGSDHAAILNDGLDGLDPEKAVRIDNPSGWSLSLDNFNVSVLDIDGAGNADLLHMPYAEKYHFYRMKGDEDAGFKWVESDDIPLNSDIDFTQDSMDIQLVDINNDHLIDIVRTTGTSMEHFLNLSAYPGYEGQFGSLTAAGQPVPNTSIDSCVLMRGGMMQFHNGNLQFGDMNGDGLQDIVDFKSGNIAYWPNRGYGQWGDTDEDCTAGEYVDGTEIEMGNSPWFSNPGNEGVSIADLNGDGLADLLQIRFNAVDIWFNRGDNSFTERYTIEDTPTVNSGFYSRVRLADMNGSGTVDIVWADAGGYQYLDLAGYYRDLEGNGGLPAGLLEQVNNGLGGRTTLEYASSIEYMIDARESGDPWDTVAPMPMVVLKKIITKDNLDKLGGPAGQYTQSFMYRNPFYDGHEAEFKGFGEGEVWDRDRDADGDKVMDAALCTAASIARGEAPIVTRKVFHRGIRPECMDPKIRSDWGPESSACISKQHQDNPLLGLSGATLLTEAYSPCTGGVLTAAVSEIEVRKLFDSNDANDGRSVYYVIPQDGKSYKYNPSATLQGKGTPESYPWISLKDANGDSLMDIPEASYTPSSPDGTFHRTESIVVNDNHGYPVKAEYLGFHRYSSADLYKYADCDQRTEFFTNSFDPMTWVHTAVDSHMVGPTSESGEACENICTPDHPCNQMHKTYTDYGELQETAVQYWDHDGATPRETISVRREYNEFGQVTHEYGGCNGTSCKRHKENVYTSEDEGDLFYFAHVRDEIAYVPDGAVKRFVTHARWDAGLGVITEVVGAAGAAGAVEYDTLGRFLRSYAAHPQTGRLCPEPMKEVYYHYETAPLAFVETWVNTSKEFCGSNRWEVMYTFVDGLGKPYASIAPGDKELGSAAVFPWMVSGLATLNAKGAPIESCESMPISSPVTGPEEVIALQEERKSALAAELPLGRWNCGKQEFDEFGRAVTTYTPSDHPDAQDGYVISKAVYGVDSGDSYDHLDLFDPDNLGTYSSQRVDGLGRVVESVTRHNEGQTAGVTERKILAKYGAIGGPVVLTREEDGVKVSRRAAYDTIGQLRVNMDLNFGKWEYQYDNLGQLVQTVSPTGNVGTYEYDAAGRQIRESHNNQVEAEYFYDQYPGDEVLGLSDNFEWEGYPAYGVTIGRLVAVKDRAGLSLSAADYGSYSESWRQINPDDQIYHLATKLNGAGELVYAEDPDGARSYADYYESGAIKGTAAEVRRNSAWERKQIVEDTKYNYQGQAEMVTFGDGGNTKVWSGFNPVTHQSRATIVQQDRAGTKATLLAFGYQYDVIGKLTGIADWRGRAAGQGTSLADLNIPHPSAITGQITGYHQFGFPSDFDEDMTGPSELNSSTTPTKWPVGMTPSDAVFEYDTLYQLTGETRQYITGSGDDVVMDEEGQAGQRRARNVTWDYDSQGSMNEWVEGGSNPAASVNLGRALGHITNGYQLNLTSGCDMNWYAENNTAPSNCYRPDALYFAENIDEVGAGRGTCVWVSYDNAGQMAQQTIRTGCSVCAFADGNGYQNATCPGANEEGTPGTAEYLPKVDAEIIRYDYFWNALGQLSGAKKYVNNAEKVTMSYAYDASGSRVIREKSEIVSDPTNIYQDLYISGGYERRQVQLHNESGTPISINASDSGEKTFTDVDGTRLVKYAAGARIQRKFSETIGGLEDAQVFLSFDNHLGSASAVIDYDDGKLVEWNTNFAYGAFESRWKNPDAKYDNADEPYGFTGKEEDEAVGLHYFGARYYSSYLGRWLSPDAPVVHSGGYTNFYNYGANSPYIYVDPDGNFIQAIIGAIVGAVVGVVTTLATGGDWKHALLNGLIGAAVGAVTGGVGSVVSSAAASAGATAFSAAVAGAVASSATAAAMNFAISVASGANTGQAALNAGMSFAIGVIGGMAGAGIGRAGISAVGTFVANTAVNAGLSAGATVIKAAAYSGGDLSESDFDDTMRDWAVGTFIGTAASAVSAGVEGLAASGTTGGDDDVIIGTPQDYKSEIRRSGNGATRTFTEEKNVPHVSKQISAYVEDKSRINCTGWALGRNSKIMPRMGTAEKPGATVPEMFNDLGYKMKEVEFNDIKESDIIVHYLKRPNGQTYGPEDGQIQMMMEGKLTHKVDIHTEIVTKVYNTKDSMGVNQVHTESMAGQFVKGTEPDVWKRVISPYEKYYRLVPK